MAETIVHHPAAVQADTMFHVPEVLRLGGLTETTDWKQVTCTRCLLLRGILDG
jgi:hypothetical protein